MPQWVPRSAWEQVVRLVPQLRIVMVSGPRQSGKTTLVRRFLSEAGGSFRTLDDPSTLRAALDDPSAFVGYGAAPRGIDEVHLGGESLVRAMKVSVDDDPRPGRFVLSGSSRFLSIPTLSESLAGRVVFVDLWPLSMAERTDGASDLMARLFADPAELVRESEWMRADYLNAVVDGGFPEVLRIPDDAARQTWYEGYLSTVINRDVQAFADVTKAQAFGQLLRLLAARTGGLATEADLAQHVELSRETTKNYLAYADLVYLTTRVPAWSDNRTNRIVKSPKVYPVDSGLAAHLLSVRREDLAEPGAAYTGELVETFVANELTKAISASDLPVRLFHLRTTDQREVDFVLEGPAGKLIGIEVKASTSPSGDATKGLRWLREQVGDRLHAGILLHLGQHASERGDRIYALPLSVLWGHGSLVS